MFVTKGVLAAVVNILALNRCLGVCFFGTSNVRARPQTCKPLGVPFLTASTAGSCSGTANDQIKSLFTTVTLTCSCSALGNALAMLNPLPAFQSSNGQPPLPARLFNAPARSLSHQSVAGKEREPESGCKGCSCMHCKHKEVTHKDIF